MLKDQKDKIRKQIRDKKKEFSIDEKRKKSAFIFEKIEKLDSFKNAKTIMAYWSMDDEVFTHEFILKHYTEKQIILPVVNSDYLDLKEFTGLSNMVSGKSFKIGEPLGDNFIEKDKIDFVIIPGVAFDKKMNRLGRGKAYYDKLLLELKALKVGVCFDFQLIESIPTDQFDVPIDLVITD